MREEELKDLLQKERADMIFVVETDTKMILEEKDYRVSGYKTILPKRAETSNK